LLHCIIFVMFYVVSVVMNKRMYVTDNQQRILELYYMLRLHIYKSQYHGQDPTLYYFKLTAI